MSKIQLITGGVRCGKSRFAAQSCTTDHTAYIATMVDGDAETHARIQSHQEHRNPAWLVLEEPELLAKAVNCAICNSCKQVIVDCLTLFASNLLFQLAGSDMETGLDTIPPEVEHHVTKVAMDEIQHCITLARKAEIDLFFVTNETGWSIVPENPVARVYRDILARINRDTAALCDEVYFCICGIPWRIR